MSDTRRERCQAAIYKRDVPRYTGRGKGGFEMHYRKEQCSRAAVKDGLCRQHQYENHGRVTRVTWSEFIDEKPKKVRRARAAQERER